MATIKKVDFEPAEPEKSGEMLQASVAPGEGETPENELIETGEDFDHGVDPGDYKKDELQDKARAVNLDDSGTKEELASRLSEHAEEGMHKPEVLRPYVKE